ncbi:uncharacterized protein [Epargyreus clarus]|uniref:uncharacterized protein n=1 Tax=Epargyreus clarus TaxID=520877 RepID=UPI003C2B2D8E
MVPHFLVLSMVLKVLSAVYLNEYEEITHRNYMPTEEVEFEPVTVLSKEKEKYISSQNLNCDDFSRFALNCTVEAAFIYNSTRISPPMPDKIGDWCRAIKHLVNCAIDWNAECKDITQDHFNEEGIKGHIHVIRSVCDDEWFLTRYMDLSACIENKASIWETCYSTFKDSVELEKNTTNEWTHYETHFNLCCARAKFRRCTLGSLFRLQANCSYENAVTLQKFSVIISEGAVYQDCDRNMMYSNCPGGDPRPSKNLLGKLMSSDAFNEACLLETKMWPILLLVYFDLLVNKLF